MNTTREALKAAPEFCKVTWITFKYQVGSRQFMSAASPSTNAMSGKGQLEETTLI
jgi:hypothetical protein